MQITILTSNFFFAVGKVEVEPKQQKQKEGSRVEFKCIHHGNEKVFYIWRKDNTEISGQCSSTLVLDSVKLRDFGYYECAVVLDSDDAIVPSSPGELDVVPLDGKSECCH